jgi:hypothetical protein
MPNEKGWYTKEEVANTGLPYYIPTSERWTETPYEFAVLLTKSRCREFGIPILGNGAERPSAFLYNPLAGRGTNDKTHRYVPLYDRSSVFETGEIDMDRLYKREFMRKEVQENP